MEETRDSNSPLPVNLIRTVAIILVILLHASNESNLNINFMSPEGVQLWWASDVFGSIARTSVPLFVILTGALLLQPSKTDESLGVFFKKRWNRIGIPIIFWAIIFFAWSTFVNGQTLTPTTIIQGVLTGPYVHFWYVYLLLGLYLITPIVRIWVKHANWKIMRYFFCIWFIGTGIMPLLSLINPIRAQTIWFNQNVFLLTGLIGYFILGAYITKIKIRPRILYSLLILSTLWTIIGTYFLIATIGEYFSTFFQDASSFSIIIASVSLFLIFATISNQKLQIKSTHLNQILETISLNTLPIYLFHLIILESLQHGYLGFKLSVTTLNPIIAIPLVTIVTLLISIAIIVPLKKIPYVAKIIG